MKATPIEKIENMERDIRSLPDILMNAEEKEAFLQRLSNLKQQFSNPERDRAAIHSELEKIHFIQRSAFQRFNHEASADLRAKVEKFPYYSSLFKRLPEKTAKPLVEEEKLDITIRP